MYGKILPQKQNNSYVCYIFTTIYIWVMERNKLIQEKNYSTEQLSKESMKGDFIKLRDFIAARGTILNVHYTLFNLRTSQTQIP